MNRILKRFIFTDYKRLIALLIILIISLILSALIFLLTGHGQDSIASINYNNISQLTFKIIFLKILKRNIIYFIAVICLTCIGQGKLINGLFGLISVFYGLSIIYLIKTMQTDKIYFILTFTDYFIFFPLIFYFTYISGSISKYTKITKKIETISHKFDIIISGYIKLSIIYLAIVLCYSLGYSYYILILSRLLVK